MSDMDFTTREEALARLAASEQEVAYLRARLDRTEAELEQAHGERDELAQKVAALAEAWDEGFEAGHTTARAVNPEWPASPVNPHRSTP